MNNSLSAKLSAAKLLPLAAVIFVIVISAGCSSSGTSLSTTGAPTASETVSSGGTDTTGGSTTSGTSGTTAPAGGTTTGSSGTGGTSVAPTTTAGLPTPPANAVVFSNTEDTTGNWADCSDCAGGAVTTDYSSAANQTTPSLDGSSREFHVGSPAWADVLWYERFGPYDQVPNYPYNYATNFLWDFYVYFDAASIANLESAEYDAFQSIAGQQFMMGSECVFGQNLWHVWDSFNRKWITAPGVPCPRFSPDTWHHIAWYTTRLSATQYKFNTLVVDDKSYTINMTFNAQPTNWGDVIGVQWELDLNGNNAPAHEWVDKSTFTVW